MVNTKLKDVRERLLKFSIPEPNSGCWLWMGDVLRQKPRGERPSLRISGKKFTAHRLSFESFRGPIPEGLIVCHTCHNEMCINPDHLYAGTHQQNVDDMMRAGRHFYTSNPAAKAALLARLSAVHEMRREKRRNRIKCRDGHLLSGENLYVSPTTGTKICKACRRRYFMEYEKRRKDKKCSPQ